MEGWLTKKGQMIPNWKRRWFVLVEAVDGSAKLEYYKDETRTEKKGECRVISSSSIEAPDRNRVGFSFELVTGSRVLRMKAAAIADRDAWLSAILRCIHRGNGTINKIRTPPTPHNSCRSSQSVSPSFPEARILLKTLKTDFRVIALDLLYALDERRGLRLTFQHDRARLVTLSDQKEKLTKSREDLIQYTNLRDADEAFGAIEAKQISPLAQIFSSRTTTQIQSICSIYYRKYGHPIHSKISNCTAASRSILGSMFGTESMINTQNLITYRLLPRGDLDAALLRDFVMSSEPQINEVLEVLLARSRPEIECALERYKSSYAMSFRDALGGSNFIGYRHLVAVILATERHEDSDANLSEEKIFELRDEIYSVIDQVKQESAWDMFTRLYSSVSRSQFGYLLEKCKRPLGSSNPGIPLEPELRAYFDGQCGVGVSNVIMDCLNDKYEFLAKHLEALMLSFSTGESMGKLAR